MKIKTLTALALLPFVLGACETMDSFSGLFEPKETQTAQAQAETLNDTILAAAGTENCPSIQIMSDLQQMVQFKTQSEPTPDNELSRIEIKNVGSNCALEDEAIALKIDITFDGSVQPTARVKENDTVNFSYPYFVAVTDEDGKILAKEIFAASVSYSSEQETIKQIETINQLLPKTRDASDYTVLLGFQLNEEQLIYNRTQISPAAGEENVEDNTINIE